MIATAFAFLTSSIGKYVLIGGLALALAIGIRQSGYNSAMRKCEAAVIQSKLDAARADLAAEQAARSLDKQAMDELAAEKLKTDSDNEKLRVEIEALPLADRCIITPERAKRMQ